MNYFYLGKNTKYRGNTPSSLLSSLFLLLLAFVSALTTWYCDRFTSQTMKIIIYMYNLKRINVNKIYISRCLYFPS